MDQTTRPVQNTIRAHRGMIRATSAKRAGNTRNARSDRTGKWFVLNARSIQRVSKRKPELGRPEAARGCVYTRPLNNGLYFVLNLCKHAVTDEELVIYKRWDVDDGKVWAMSRADFDKEKFVHLLGVPVDEKAGSNYLERIAATPDRDDRKMADSHD